uniref:Uncharacterized protein n=2 Tax=Peridiniales TaxID=2910 RepID=A8I1Z6_HETRO|nr:unknown [Heterocapsa triquetra]ABV72573.1 unknown [Heterocapsa rotundata]|mmetsp:Transcript_52821/g.136396  ORF Transcript_52821/g.136396 Transcript_52821/m.136396 type:complete len:123 (+) Transcript_52821:87-455(+)
MALPMKKAAMKAAKAGAMKAMKAKKVSKVAKGKFAKAVVMRGSKAKTSGGLTKDQLFKNKRGKIVSKKASAAGKKRFAAIKGWFDAVKSARKALNVSGFVAINGKTSQGKALYAKAKAMYSS